MIPAFVCLAIISTLLYILLEFSFGPTVKSFKTKTSQENNHGSKRIKQEELVPLPQLRMWKVILWHLLVGRGKMTSLLLHIGKVSKIVDFKCWKSRYIIINDFQLGKELFKNAVFCGKPVIEVWNYYSRGSFGIINTFGETWKGQRKFCHQHLKNFGLGTKSMETLMQSEIEELIESWSQKKGQPFSPNKEFYLPIISSLWVLLSGERASKTDKQLVSLVYASYGDLRKTFEFPELLIMSLNLKLETVNRIVNWIPIFPGIKAFQKSTTELRSFFRSIIGTRRKTLASSGSPSNFMDAYLQKIYETTDTESDFFGEQGEMHLLGAMLDFFIAGGDTTANMLAWAMLHLIRNPHVQEKIRGEIDTVVGTTRSPCLLDRPMCPYTEAFLLEVLRWDTVTAVSLPHAPMEDTNIGPYFVEKGVPMVLNIYNIHHNPAIWGDPETFRPERFLSEDGKTVVKHEALCTFSFGPRRCVGEQTARDNLFLFVSSICQRFVLKPDPLANQPPVHDNRKSVLHVPKKYFMVACDRLEPKACGED